MKSYPFWVPDYDRVKDHKTEYPNVSKIFEHPTAYWYGQRTGKPIKNLSKRLNRLFNRADDHLPVLVMYNLPNRDMGHYSKGGGKSHDAYLDFVQEFSQGIGDRKPIVIFEPDGLPHTLSMNKRDADQRISLMTEGLFILANTCKARIYIDIGHSNWLEPEQAGKLLNSIIVDRIPGFSVNVSNYRSTTESIRWAERVGEYTDRRHFVIDTSRNGNGAYGNEWCNPPGRSLGHPPTTDTKHNLCDALLWVKIPGESDGYCNGGPRAGKFWPEYASDLVNNTEWIK